MPDVVTPKQMQSLRNANDRYGRNTSVRNPTGWCDQLVITAGTPQNWTRPAGAAFVVITSEDGVTYCKANGTGTRPTGAATDGSAWDFNPTSYALDGVNTIRIDTSVNTIVHMEVYAQ